MAQPSTSFDLSYEEIEKLPTDQKEKLRKEWADRIEEARKKPGADNLRSDNPDHDIPSHGFPYTNTHASNPYETPYSSHSGGPHRSRYHGASYGASQIPSVNGSAHPGAPNNNASHHRHHPYPQLQHQRHQNRHHPYYQPQYPRYQNWTATFPRTGPSANDYHPSPNTTLCSAFTLTGICTRTECRYMHDQDKVAICKAFLYKDNCSKSDDCPLSHTASPHNTIACVHFRNGSCTKKDCRFAHVLVSPSAAVCEAFSRLGYCEKGSTCADRHAFNECPSFANNGTCKAGKGCPLVHVRHAGRLRKACPSAEAESPPSLSNPLNNTLADKTPGIFTIDKSDNFEREALNVALNDQSDVGESDEPNVSNYKAGTPPHEKPGKRIDDQQNNDDGLSEQADFIAFDE